MEVSKITIESGTYPIKDSNSRLRLEKIENKKIILIGDSYGDGYSPDGSYIGWCDRVKNKLISQGFNENNIYITHKGGACFSNLDNSYLTLLKGIENVITNKTYVSHIVVGGGYNEAPYSSEVISLYLSNFLDYCKNTYPNAIVINFPFGATISNVAIQNAINRNVVSAYANLIRDNYICVDCNYTLTYRNMFSSDGIHPNDYGLGEIAKLVHSFLNGVNYQKPYSIYYTTGLTDGFNGTIACISEKQIGLMYISIDSVSNNLKNIQGGITYPLFTPNNNQILNYRAPFVYYDGECIILDNDGYHNVPYKITNNESTNQLEIVFRLVNENRTNFYNFTNVTQIQFITSFPYQER